MPQYVKLYMFFTYRGTTGSCRRCGVVYVLGRVCHHRRYVEQADAEPQPGDEQTDLANVGAVAQISVAVSVNDQHVSIQCRLYTGCAEKNCLFRNRFITNFPENIPVKKKLKIGQHLAKIWTKVAAYFFGPPCIRQHTKANTPAQC